MVVSMNMEHSPGVPSEFAFETSSFMRSYFKTLLNPLVWNVFILSQTLLLGETEQENTLLKVKMTGSSENIKPVVQCPRTWPGAGTAVPYRLQQNGAQGIAPPASPSTPIVPGLQGLLAAREAILTGCILTTTSVCSAVSHCLLAAACKQRSADFTMPMAVLLLYHPVQLRVGCYYLSCVKHGLCCSLWCFLLAKPFNSSNHLYFYAKRRDTYILQIHYFFPVWEKKRGRNQERNVFSLTCSKGNCDFYPCCREVHNFLQPCSCFYWTFYSVKM